VVNRGYSDKKERWEESVGKAYFVDSEDSGYLKVSFFGPFYGAYVVFELDQENYAYSFVSGPDTSYLWLLSRTPEVPAEVVQRFTDKAASLGFDTESLIFVKQDRNAD
jgi:apolipoprotein D and lipocalin family protein